MPSLEVHCRLTTRLFGKPHEEVHRWLNEFEGQPPYGSKHRHVRHHWAGVLQVWGLYGGEAAEVAQAHIELDLLESGWNYGQPFPMDEEHYVSLGYP